MILPLDRTAMTATFAPGIVIPLKPFFGSMGVAPPPEAGRVSSNPPGTHAGNLDNRELVAGTTLWIPVHVAGALFEVGDGHAAQGDGEVDQTAIETSLRGRLQLTVRKGMKLAWPRAETATDYISMGTDLDLTQATRTAIQEMVDFLVATRGLDRQAAYQLTSIAGNVAITQLVDGKVGVHVKMPKGDLPAVSGAGRRGVSTYIRIFSRPAVVLEDLPVMRSRRYLIPTLVLTVATVLAAQPATKGGINSIQPDALKEWLGYIASDDLQGRQIYTEGLGLAAAYIADHLKEWGVKPGGDNGTYFQTVKVVGVKTTSRASVTVDVNGQ